MIQQILIGIIFLAAVLYLSRLLWRNFSPGKEGCAKGCGCSVSNSAGKLEVIKKGK